MITLNKIKKIYGSGQNCVIALDDINLHIDEGDFVAILGKSGSGKSTLLHILGALDRYDEGDYFLDGQDMNQCSDKELAKIRNDSIGLVMQDFALLGDKTVIFNVTLPMFFDHTPFKDMKRLAEIALQETGIFNLKNKKVNQLSGGQKQRVSIARAIVKRPMLILADEPTGALDSKTGIEIMDMLSNLNKEGITIIVVTHDRDIASFCHRQITLGDGKVISDITDDE